MVQLLTDPVLLIVQRVGGPIEELGLLLRIRTVQVKCFGLVVIPDGVRPRVERAIIRVAEHGVLRGLRPVGELVPQRFRLFKHVLVLGLLLLSHIGTTKGPKFIVSS